MTCNHKMFVCIPVTPESMEDARARWTHLLETPLLLEAYHERLLSLLPELSGQEQSLLAEIVTEMGINAGRAKAHGKVVNAMLCEAVIMDPERRKEALQ